ncbi:hypothetical protein [Segatella oulorum]|uniref:hypothetical protein n=1 Tax=Segatella oulorum TaxID=28136 RepID=UPI00031C6881|nr:hypothetical protein [Segatella oulorum]
MIYLLRVIETIGCKITKNSCKPFINGATFRVSWAKVAGRGSAGGQKRGRLPEEAPPMDKNKKRLPEEAPPMDKHKK